MVTKKQILLMETKSYFQFDWWEHDDGTESPVIVEDIAYLGPKRVYTNGGARHFDDPAAIAWSPAAIAWSPEECFAREHTKLDQEIRRLQRQLNLAQLRLSQLRRQKKSLLQKPRKSRRMRKGR